METNKMLIGIGGEAGAGIMESGNLLAKYALSNGLNAFVASEYPSLIRGGHNYSVVNISQDNINSLSQEINLLIALNKETIDLHLKELSKNSAVIYDLDSTRVDSNNESNIAYLGVPLTSIAKESGGPDIIRNTVAVGAAIGLIQGDFNLLSEILKTIFAKKGQEVIDMNIKAALKGFRYVQSHHEKTLGYSITHQAPDPNKILLSGNDAMSIGAIRAGLKFAAIYPMTPITSVLDYLAAQANKYNMVVKEPEDEISAIIMAIGASFAGARSMTATSGGGFCLMTEGLGMSGIAEIPLVIIEGMRSGPSSAMATKTEQSDLDFVLHSGHGEFPRIVVAPGDATECLAETFNAFNLADKYQLPVVVVTDKYLASSLQTIDKPQTEDWQIDRGKITASKQDLPYARYAFAEDGISPRAFPGVPGLIQHATSYEHDPAGHDNDDPKIRVPMMEKRMRKMETLSEELPEPQLYGPKDADITIFGWGSNKGVILDTLKILETEGVKANYLHLLYLLPFPSFHVAQVFDEAKDTLIVENNYTGQMARHISACTGRRFKNKLLKYDGTPFFPEEVAKKVKEILNGDKSPSSPVAIHTGVKHA